MVLTCTPTDLPFSLSRIASTAVLAVAASPKSTRTPSPGSPASPVPLVVANTVGLAA